MNSANPDFKKPRQLAAVSNHSGTIHTVRFSSNGKYLASGADDRVVCVYVLDPNPVSHSTFGTEYHTLELASLTEIYHRKQRGAAC